MSKNNQAFKALLVTNGRKTGNKHTVELLAVMHNDKIYFSRRNPNSDWLKNAISNPQVQVKFDDSDFSGNAELVKDETLAKKISHLKYADEKRANEARVVLEVEITK